MELTDGVAYNKVMWKQVNWFKVNRSLIHNTIVDTQMGKATVVLSKCLTDGNVCSTSC